MKKIIIASITLTILLSNSLAIAACNPFLQDCGPFHSDKKNDNKENLKDYVRKDSKEKLAAAEPKTDEPQFFASWFSKDAEDK